MRATLFVIFLFAGHAGATDFRDCKEFYVYSPGAILPDTKTNGAVWDEGSAGDPELLARVKGRTDIPWKVVGPKIQDAPAKHVTWSAVSPADVKTGKWLPVRVGDVIELKLVERDAFSDDIMGSSTFEIPKDVSTSGFVLAPVSAGSAKIQVAVSATDGAKLCAGATGATTDVAVSIKPGAFGRPDAAAFETIRANNKCDLNGNSAACRESSYLAAYPDLNGDGTTDTVVTGGPFGTGKSTSIVGAWLGWSPTARRQLFVGECDELSISAPTQLVCNYQGKSTAVRYDGSQPKTEVVLAAGKARTTASGVVVLKTLTSGDTGCYAEFAAADGRTFSIVGDFDLCGGGTTDARPMIGKRVTYETEKVNVLAASCEGDVDCGKVDEVEAVKAIRLAK